MCLVPTHPKHALHALSYGNYPNVMTELNQLSLLTLDITSTIEMYSKLSILSVPTQALLVHKEKMVYLDCQEELEQRVNLATMADLDKMAQ